MSEKIKVSNVRLFSEIESKDLWEIFHKYKEMKEIKLSGLIKQEVKNDLKWLVNNRDTFYDKECISKIDKLIEWLKYLLENWVKIEIKILLKYLKMRGNNLWVFEIESKRFMYQIWLEVNYMYGVELYQINKKNDRLVIKNKNNFFLLDKALEKVDMLKNRLYKYLENLELNKIKRVEKMLNHNFNFVKKDSDNLLIFNKTKNTFCKKCNVVVDFEMIITLDKINSLLDVEIYDKYESNEWNLLDSYMISLDLCNKKYIDNVVNNFNSYINQDENECYECIYE